MFFVKQIIWAKTKGYPWWPAEISKLPTVDQNFFKVAFIGQSNHAHLQEKAVKKYLENYEAFRKVNYKGLQNSIELANIQMEKRKAQMTDLQNKTKNCKNTLDKCKKIKKKNKKKLKLRKNFSKQIKPLNDNIKVHKDEALQKVQKKMSEQLNSQKAAAENDGGIKSEIESVYVSEENQSIQVNQLEYLRNVDRKKIQNTEEKLFSFITRFNSNIYDKQRQCFEVIENIQREEFKSEELLQSKITNMITYIHKKLCERSSGILKKDQIDKISSINHHLKQKVVSYLFDCCYYDQYLKRMQKNSMMPVIEKQQKLKTQPRVYTKKNRKYKRKLLPKRKNIVQALK